jgi:hypothetical protein
MKRKKSQVATNKKSSTMRKSNEKVHMLIHCHHRIVLVLQGRACVQQFHHSHEKKTREKVINT